MKTDRIDDLTLREKVSAAQHSAALEAAEKHFFDAAQPHFPLGFSVSYRNPGHWDVFADQCPGKVSAFNSLPGCSTSGRDGQRERAFRIRGESGNVLVIDERWNPHMPRGDRGWTKFKSVMVAMLWIMEELMQEPKP